MEVPRSSAASRSAARREGIRDKRLYRNSADIRPVFKLVALNLRARAFSKLSLVTALTKRGIWSAFRDWLTETDLYDLFLAANDFREDPPSIHRGTFRSPLCSQGAVATLLVATPDRRWVCSISLPPHPIRNRGDPRRSHRAVTCSYVIIRYPEKIVGVIKKVHRKYKREQRGIIRRKFADFAFWKISKNEKTPLKLIIRM